jgi:hypothetical protein
VLPYDHPVKFIIYFLINILSRLATPFTLSRLLSAMGRDMGLHEGYEVTSSLSMALSRLLLLVPSH